MIAFTFCQRCCTGRIGRKRKVTEWMETHVALHQVVDLRPVRIPAGYEPPDASLPGPVRLDVRAPEYDLIRRM